MIYESGNSIFQKGSFKSYVGGAYPLKRREELLEKAIQFKEIF